MHGVLNESEFDSKFLFTFPNVFLLVLELVLAFIHG